jgi:ribosome-binding protein aMBF1 (putative translation factor)
MEHQDWTTVVLKKRGLSNKPTASHLANGTFETVRKTSAGPNMKKLENDTENFSHAKVSRTLSQAIVRARVDKKMSREDLAKAIFETEKVVSEYELRHAIPDPKILNKMARVLGVPLNKNM